MDVERDAVDTRDAVKRALVGLALLFAACTTDDSLVLVVDPPDAAPIARVGLRVWNTEMTLVADYWLEVGDGEGQVSFPWRVPLVPDGEARWFLAEVELYDASLCPFARASVSGRSGEAAPSLSFVDTGMTGCATVFVAADGGAGACAELSPCASVRDAISDITAAGRPEVVFLRGDSEYLEADGVLLTDGDGSGEEGAPFVLRAWPGTGTPRLRTQGESVVRSCCNVDAAHHFVLDGLDLSGGIRFGVELNGSAATGGVVRHCVIHDNGLDAPAGPDRMDQVLGRRDAAISTSNDATDHLFEFNILRDTGVRGPGSPAELPGVGVRIADAATLRGNLIVGNAQDGVVVGGGQGDVLIEGNLVCHNGAAGISATRSAQASRNTVVANEGAGIQLEDAAESANNLIANNGGVGVSDPSRSRGDWLHNNADGGADPDPRFLDIGACVLTLRSDSPARDSGAGAR